MTTERKTLWLVTAGVVFGLLAGGGIGLGGATLAADEPTPVKESREYADLLSERDGMEQDLRDVEDELIEIEGHIPDREAAVEASEADLAQRELDVTAAEKAVARRERRVGIVEDAIAANTISGEGMYKVGSEIQPGTYKTNGSPGCYYAILNSTDTFDIADNGNVDGPAFATVATGQYFEVSGCADWVLQP